MQRKPCSVIKDQPSVLEDNNPGVNTWTVALFCKISKES